MAQTRAVEFPAPRGHRHVQLRLGQPHQRAVAQTLRGIDKLVCTVLQALRRYITDGEWGDSKSVIPKDLAAAVPERGRKLLPCRRGRPCALRSRYARRGLHARR